MGTIYIDKGQRDKKTGSHADGNGEIKKKENKMEIMRQREMKRNEKISINQNRTTTKLTNHIPNPSW